MLCLSRTDYDIFAKKTDQKVRQKNLRLQVVDATKKELLCNRNGQDEYRYPLEEVCRARDDSNSMPCHLKNGEVLELNTK